MMPVGSCCCWFLPVVFLVAVSGASCLCGDCCVSWLVKVMNLGQLGWGNSEPYPQLISK